MTIISYPAAHHLVSTCAARMIVWMHNPCICTKVTCAHTRVSMQYACMHVCVPESSIAFATSLHYISSYLHETLRAKQAAKYNILLAIIHNYMHPINIDYYSDKLCIRRKRSEAMKL